VLDVRDEVVLGAVDTLAAAQGAVGEAAKDEDQDIFCEDAHSIHLIGDLLHLDKDLLERHTHTNQMEACFLLT
jgi:hypothetical protein